MAIPERARRLVSQIKLVESLLADLQTEYHEVLAEDDRINQVAFLLYQREVAAEEDWEGEVTWEHWWSWWSLQTDSDRDEWRDVAVAVISIIEGTTK